MQVGIIELGQIWANIARRLLRRGREAIVYDRAVAALAQQGAAPAAGLVVVELVRKLGKPRAIWLTPPAGEVTRGALRVLGPGDAVVDGGNALWKDDIRRAAALKQRRVHDIEGRQRGCCLTMGGRKHSVDRLDRIFTDLVPQTSNVPVFSGRDGRDLRIDCSYIRPGSSSAGHFVKMVHNAIEYGSCWPMPRFSTSRKMQSRRCRRPKVSISTSPTSLRRGDVAASSPHDCSIVRPQPTMSDRPEQAATDAAADVDVLPAACAVSFASCFPAMRKGFGRLKALQP
jgi:hypothetical protein